MDSTLLLAIVMRWVHIFSAITAVGGIFFIFFLLTPVAARTLPDRQPELLRAALMKRWRIVVHSTILLFLISGLYNYFFITRLLHPDQPLYHALWGIKVLLSLVIFALAIGLSSDKSWSKRMREQTATWTTLLIILAVIVVLISGVLKNLPHLRPAAIAFSATANDGGVSLSLSDPGD
jgi:uncharacterized membrane protein